MNDDERQAERDPQTGDQGRNGPSLFLVLAVVVALLTAVFIAQNGETVSAEFLWFDKRIRLWVAIVVSIGLGIVLDRLILTWWRRARRRRDER